MQVGKPMPMMLYMSNIPSEQYFPETGIWLNMASKHAPKQVTQYHSKKSVGTNKLNVGITSYV